ncbi:PD-(D/E)XK nuclease family protein [Agrococcus sp. Marseille-Q4369]|uniref:PD-(D/E)XK nuclease family protein n=1 Tax=Agrococcus sp. Marseille-Q4369 TaxID=2810513 RepID=UPI001B8AA980|nr:PD-(D/E)XK nuclease family protein [Agrococcus sp. Marseille-Q4369]QUW18231.1 PD-(D/E)XK nuclease family protein [Agrococcus sp. Marseille-Q4369]
MDSGPPLRSFEASAATAGSVVHAALQLWLERESWTGSEPLTALRSALKAAELSLDTRLMALPSGGRALQSLRSIATHLSELLVVEGARSQDLSVEVLLVSRVDRFWGVPDLVVEATRTLIVDFKTGLQTAQASEAAQRQLMFYAHLLRSQTGRAADELVVLSPARADRVRCDEKEVELYIERLRSLRETSSRNAAPEQGLCTYCR